MVNPLLLVGFPDRARIEAYRQARLQSMPRDLVYVRLDELPADAERGLIQWLREQPVDAHSTARTLIAEIGGLCTKAQQMLLAVAEEGRSTQSMILVADRPGRLIPPLRSRCTLRPVPLAPYGDLVRQLVESGFSLAESAKGAQDMLHGFFAAQAPQYEVADAYLIAVGRGDTEAITRLLRTFSHGHLIALRLRLAQRGRWSAYHASYQTDEPVGAALLAAQTLISEDR